MNRFIQFMRFNHSEFGEQEHLYVFTTPQISSSFDPSDCVYAHKLFDILKLFLLSKKTDRFVLHSYSHPWLYLSCFITFWNLKKIAWFIWGGDLYFYREQKKCKYRLYEFLRKRTITHFGYFIGLRGDYFLAKKYYNISGVYLSAMYPLDIHKVPCCDKPDDTLNVLVGNSADEGNNHLEILEYLAKYKAEKLRLYAPLSYGGSQGYKDEVDKCGMNIFGDKYTGIREYMDISEYNIFLSSLDVIICNHNRQQALGNLFTMMRMGKKVFIREGITTVDLFNDLGLSYSLISQISLMSFADFSNFDLRDKLKNQEIVQEVYSNEYMREQWNNVFKCLRC